ncbi:unnamed protein product, partial [Oppiella nova]
KKSSEEKPTSTIISIEESISTVVANTYSPSSTSVASEHHWSPAPIRLPSPTHKSSQLQTVLSPKPPKHTQPVRPKCGMCDNRAGDDNELITCSLCGISGHAISCLNCSQQLLKRIKESSRWECPNCKKCGICGEPDIDLVICIVCDRGYHSQCIKLPNNFTVSKYICEDCKPKPVVKTSTKKASHSVSTVSVHTKAEKRFVAEELTSIKPLKGQRVAKSATQLKAEKLRKNAEKARKQRERRAAMRLRAEAIKHKTTTKAKPSKPTESTAKSVK